MCEIDSRIGDGFCVERDEEVLYVDYWGDEPDLTDIWNCVEDECYNGVVCKLFDGIIRLYREGSYQEAYIENVFVKRGEKWVNVCRGEEMSERQARKRINADRKRAKEMFGE